MASLVLYNSSMGNTEAVAKYIAEKTGGKAISLKSGTKIEFGEYDRIFIGCRVHAGGITKTVAEFVKDNREVLNSRNAKYFICCMYKDEKGNKQLEKIKKKYELPNCVYFASAKKKIAEGNVMDIDSFIES